MLACLKSSDPGVFNGFLAAGKRWKCFHVTGNVETKAKRSKNRLGCVNIKQKHPLEA